MLTKKLTQEEKADILAGLFGFYFEEGVLWTDDGDDFFAFLENQKHNFDTLEGIFKYHAERCRGFGFKLGAHNVRTAIKEALGLC